MSLKNTTVLAAMGICYNFALRTMGTFWPDLFKNLQAAQVISILSLLASLTFVLFCISFYKGYLREEQSNLKKATLFATIGTSAVSLLQVKGLFRVFDKLTVRVYDIAPHLVGLIRSRHAIEPMIPWLASISVLVFFAVLHRETLRYGQMGLKKATLLALVGSSIGLLLRTLGFCFYLYSSKTRWLVDLSRTIQVIFLPITAFSFVALLYFFISFYKVQKTAH